MKIINDASTLMDRANERYTRTLKLHRERWKTRVMMWLLIAFVALALLICAVTSTPHLF